MDELTQIEIDSHHGDDKGLSLKNSKAQCPENRDTKKLQGIWQNEKAKSFGAENLVGN